MNKLLVISIVGILLLLSASVLVYQENKGEIKYCDSINIKSDYDGEPICYKQPTSNSQTKLIPLTK